MEIFSPDSKLMSTINRAADIFALNVLWLVFSIPIITMGAATTAKYAVAMKVVRGKMPELIKEFWKAFKSNFKQATLIWLPMLFVIAMIGYETLFVMGMEDSSASIIMIILLIILVLVLMMLMWGWPMLARFEMKYLSWYRNAMLISLLNLPTGILIFALSISPYVLFYFYPEWLVAELAITIISGYIIAAQSVKILKKFEPEGYVDPDDEFVEDESHQMYEPEEEYDPNLEEDPELQMYKEMSKED